MSLNLTRHNQLTAIPVALSLLILAVLLSAILFVPRSTANQDNQTPLSQKRERPQFVPGEALVRFKQGRAFEGSTNVAAPIETPSMNRESGVQSLALSQEQIAVDVERFEGSRIVDGLRIARMAPEDTTKAIAALKARDDVLYAEPNYIRHVDRTPNDTSFGQLYGLMLIGAPQVWDSTIGDRSVVVGVIDEGIDVTHPDLQANIWINPAPGSISGITGDVNGYDFLDNTGVIPADTHATHVAGTIGAVGNNNLGVVGVNWQSSLMSLKFLGASGGSTADAIRAYNYAKQMRDLWVSTSGAKGANIRALNASFGGGGYSQAEADVLNALGQSGILFVAAAGNDGRNTDLQPNYPSDYALSNVVSVAATNSADSLAGFSNFGTRTVMLGAPGVGILSTYPNSSYSILSGTSMATPHVTGAAALLCAANPNLNVNQLRALLSFNGDITTALQGKALSGRRLNVFKSLQAMNEGDVTPPGTVGSFQIAAQNGRNVTLSWIASGDDGAIGQASLYDLSFLDQNTNAVIPLTSLTPAVSGTAQSINVNVPYRHTAGTFRLREFDNVGNEGAPVTISANIQPNVADPYTTALSPPASLSTGGTPLGLNFDDRYLENYQLPFAFSYFGQLYNTITISTNGNLYFSPPPKRSNGDADDVPSSKDQLSQFKMIAGMWDDLDLRKTFRADADVYAVRPNPSTIIFRWQGVPCNDRGSGCTGGDPINFEIELDSDGTIKTRYGSGNTNLFPVVGISGGEPDAYVIDALTSELSPKSLTNAQGAVFAPRATVQFTSANYTVNEGDGRVNIILGRTGDTTSSASVSFATGDTAGMQLCNVFNGVASSRCDYVPVNGTVQFAPGETTKTVSVSIVDDSYAEGNETFSLSLSNSLGASLGAQSTASVTIIDNDAANGPNPSDLSSFFVRQHYLDFLNREPDAPGLSFWTDQINSCGLDQSCISLRRVNVSGAFFLSIEFQQTGYLVERMYKAAYGDATGNSIVGGAHQLPVPIVRFNEFLPDTQQIGQGVVVGQPGWEQVLENNKQKFTAQFVQRARFTTATAFPTSMTPAQFVDKLNQNAGNVLSSGDRATAIALFGGATDTSNIIARAQALRQIAENQNLYNAEFNRAFVLMQYFGYLRRNPNDPPEATLDYSGYDFWLTKLIAFNGNYVNAEMVKAFITAVEYRQRFGP